MQHPVNPPIDRQAAIVERLAQPAPDLQSAIDDYLEALEFIVGFPYTAYFDGAKCRIADVILRGHGLPLGPRE